MREIKFRAWNKESSRMCEGLTIQSWLLAERNNGIAEGRVGIPQTPCDEAESFWSHLIFLEFTGLHDKNGNEIYEGDIVIADSMESEKEVAEVIWDAPMFKRCSKFGTWAIDGKGSLWQVIGNIYENPELLGVE